MGKWETGCSLLTVSVNKVSLSWKITYQLWQSDIIELDEGVGVMFSFNCIKKGNERGNGESVFLYIIGAGKGGKWEMSWNQRLLYYSLCYNYVQIRVPHRYIVLHSSLVVVE